MPGFETIYSASHEPIYQDETDAYTKRIPAVKAFNTPSEYAKRPQAIRQELKVMSEDLRLIEVKRRALAFGASVLKQLAAQHPEALEHLTDEERAQVHEWAGRIVEVDHPED